MKVKKAIRKVTHAEALLADVTEHFKEGGESTIGPRDTAKQALIQFRKTLEKLRAAEPRSKSGKADVPKKTVQSATARQRVKTKTA